MADTSTIINNSSNAAAASANAAASKAAADKLAGNTGTGGTSTTTDTSKAEKDRTSLAGDFNEFMLLLTTQLKNQDPTEPLDTNQFTQQLVSFAGVEQQVNTNSNMEKLISLTQASKVDSGISYIGKGIDATGNSGFLSGGKASFVYALPVGVSKANVSLLDENGNAVFSGTGLTNEGKNIVSWDGTGNVGAANGKKMPDGKYTIAVNALDAAGKPITTGVTTYTTGLVDSASFDSTGNMTLSVGTLDIPLDQVNAVRNVTG